MIVSSVTFVFITVVSLLVTPTTIVVLANHVATIPVRILASKIRADRTLFAPFQIIEQLVHVSLEWCLVQLQQLVVCVHLPYLVLKTVDAHPVTVALMNCVDQCVPVIRIVLVMNDANEDHANRYAVETMTAETVKSAKVLFVRLDVDRMTIAQLIYRVSINNVSIHVSAVLHVEQTLNAIVSIIRSNVLALHHSLVTPILVANIQQRFAENTTIVHRITPAMETYVKLHVVAIKIVCLMNDVFEEFVEPFVIATLPVVKDKSVKIVCAKLDVEAIMFVQAIRLASTTSVPIHVQQPDSVVRAQNALLSIMVFNAVVQLASSETL